MKRNIYLIIYFVLQTVFILLFAIPVTKEFIVENIPFAINVWDGFKSLVDYLILFPLLYLVYFYL